MTNRQVQMQPLLGSEDTDVPGRSNEPNAGRLFPGPLLWHVSQPALPGLKYALAISGYVVLP